LAVKPDASRESRVDPLDEPLVCAGFLDSEAHLSSDVLGNQFVM
jgi:hypothetical protein